MEEREVSGEVRILFFTGNKEKYLEVRDLLRPYRIELVQKSEKPVEIQVEDVRKIVIACAEVLRRRYKGPGILEDTGLFVEQLNGFPGPYASYVFKKIGLSGILKLMENVSNRKARFLTAIAYWDQETAPIAFTGEVTGRITEAARGGGWGYDPIFQPDGFNKTFGEMTVEEKNSCSHRARAILKLVDWLIEEGKIRRFDQHG